MYLLTIPALLVVFFSTTSPCNATPINGPLTMPKACSGKNLCHEKLKNYPQAVIEKLLEGIGNFLNESRILPVEDRIGNEGDNECPSTVNMRPIYEIIDDKGDLRIVVQSDDKFKQILRTEECNKPGKITEETNNLPRQIVESINFTCIQCTLNYKFLVLSHNGEKLETAKARGGVPVCCSCRRLE